MATTPSSTLDEAVCRLTVLSVLAALALILGGCATLGYLAQAGVGMLEIVNRARPIDDVLRDARTRPELARLLAEIPTIKAYGESRGLKRTQNYAEFVQLDRSAVVWTVSACERLGLEPRSWRFPVAGSFTYQGWFRRDRADRQAEKLRGEGLDVDVSAASAFSTLGWFKDPVLSTMIRGGDDRLGAFVNVLLHESVHATLHVKDQTTFNESVASFIADRLTLEYLEATRGRSAREYVAYAESRDHAARRARAVRHAYDTLEAVYASARPDAEKLEEKRRVLGELAASIRFGGTLNNASLVAMRAYGSEDTDAALAEVLGACGGDWRRFLRTLATLAAEPTRFSRAQQKDLTPLLSALAREGCR